MEFVSDFQNNTVYKGLGFIMVIWENSYNQVIRIIHTCENCNNNLTMMEYNSESSNNFVTATQLLQIDYGGNHWNTIWTPRQISKYLLKVYSIIVVWFLRPIRFPVTSYSNNSPKHDLNQYYFRRSNHGFQDHI